MTTEPEINRSEIARKTRLDLSSVSRFIAGKRVPNFHQAKLLADAIGASLDELYRKLYS